MKIRIDQINSNSDHEDSQQNQSQSSSNHIRGSPILNQSDHGMHENQRKQHEPNKQKQNMPNQQQQHEPNQREERQYKIYNISIQYVSHYGYTLPKKRPKKWIKFLLAKGAANNDFGNINPEICRRRLNMDVSQVTTEVRKLLQKTSDDFTKKKDNQFTYQFPIILIKLYRIFKHQKQTGGYELEEILEECYQEFAETKFDQDQIILLRRALQEQQRRQSEKNGCLKNEQIFPHLQKKIKGKKIILTEKIQIKYRDRRRQQQIFKAEVVEKIKQAVIPSLKQQSKKIRKILKRLKD